jgi:4-amino-4-deoxy-L-arabinose transferase-like glycosyltransferase
MNVRFQRSCPDGVIARWVSLKERRWIGGSALVIVSLLLWLPYLTFPLDADAAGYATVAYWWAQGDTLYRDITITRPQGIFILFRLIAAAHLDAAIGNHLVAALYAAACVIAFLALSERIWGRKIGFTSATLFTLLLAAPFTEGYSTNAELFMLLPLLGTLYTLWCVSGYDLNRRVHIFGLLLCGLLGAIAVLIKPSAAPVALMSVGWLYYRGRTLQLLQSRFWYSAVALGLGYCLGLLPALLHGLVTAPDRYLSAVVLYRVSYDSALAGTLSSQVVSFVGTTALLLVQLPILLGALIGLYPDRVWRKDPAYLFLMGWVLVAFSGGAMGGNWFPHYYLPLLAPLTLGIMLGWRRLSRSLACRKGEYRRIAAVLGVSFVLPLLLALSLFNSAIGVVPTALHNAVTVPRSEVVASYIRAHAQPTDTIYVAYQWAPIYQLAQRKPAARWLYYRELQRTPGAFAEQVARISDPRTAPLYIVAAQPFDAFGLDSDGTLRAVVDRDYVLETTIDDIPLYRHR